MRYKLGSRVDVNINASGKLKVMEITLVSLFSSLAAVLNIIEALFIPSVIPGVKLGIANIVTVMGVFILRPGLVLGIAFLRTLIASLLLGSFLSVSYYLSFAGTMASAFVICILYHFNKKIGPVFLSIVGALVHNIAQLTVAYYVVGYGFIYYLPYLIVFAVPSGFLTGKITEKVLKARIRPAAQRQTKRLQVN